MRSWAWFRRRAGRFVSWADRSVAARPSGSPAPASRSCPRGAASSASSPSRRTSDSGSPGTGSATARTRSGTRTTSFRCCTSSGAVPPERSPAASNSSSRSAGRSSPSQTCCCSTSRRSGSHRWPSTPFSRRWARSASAGSRSCSSSSARCTPLRSPTARTCSSGAIYALMAVGIGLVFGVLRLVNFAYGQLVMAGAYTLAFTSNWPIWASVATCFAVVVALSLAMELTVFRPLRGQSPAVMLVTTFAIAFLLQAIALIVDLRNNFLGEVAASISSLNEAITVGGVEIRKVTIVAVGVAIVALPLLAFLLTRTTIGLHTRAAAGDFRTARLLGVRVNRVIAFAVVLSGILAAAVAVLLTVQTPLVAPDFALHDTIVVLIGVVVGGIDRLWTATLGGFAIGFASGIFNGVLPTDKTVYLPSVVFGLVILVLLLRPAGLFAWGRQARVERV